MHPIVRKTTEADLPRLLEIRSDPLVANWQKSDPLSLGEITKKLFHATDSDEIYAWHTIVFDDEPEGFIATTTAEVGSQTVHALGFNLNPKYWGKGIMFESLKILIDGYFREKASCMIFAQTTSTNRRCIRLLRKLKFYEVPLGLIEKIKMYWETRSFNWVRSFAVDLDMWQTRVELPTV